MWLLIVKGKWLHDFALATLKRMGFEMPKKEPKIDRSDDIIVPILGTAIRYEDVHFLERVVLDTVDVVKAWQRRYAKDDQDIHQ